MVCDLRGKQRVLVVMAGEDTSVSGLLLNYGEKNGWLEVMTEEVEAKHLFINTDYILYVKFIYDDI